MNQLDNFAIVDGYIIAAIYVLNCYIFFILCYRSIFMEMVSMNQLIIKIMNFAQRLVDADRASLFLVDAKTNQLYARIFDIKGADKDGDEGGGKDIAKEIR